MKKRLFLIIPVCICLIFASCSAYNDGGYDYFKDPPYHNQGIYSEANNEKYTEIDPNEFIQTSLMSKQAFSLKVDTASYTNVKRYINNGTLPPKDAVRTEELINYFNYESPMPETGEHPFSVYIQTAASPFGADKYMAFIRVKTPEIETSELPPSNLTFLIDTSGSMLSYDKLPLLQQAFSLLVENLTENDVVSIVTYAGSSEVVLDSIRGDKKDIILSAIYSLKAEGSTAGAQGIHTAYEIAAKNYTDGANNRVILASDGDFNVGISNIDTLKSFISEKRGSGVYLSILGFGTGNLNESIMETLAANGNGNYSYIDNLTTAEKVLVDEMGANLFVVANDVKAQISFNKANVSEFRLIGYENRTMTGSEFDDEQKDAGEIGMGTDIIVLVEMKLDKNYIGGGLFDICIRYKSTEDGKQKELNVPEGGITENRDSDFNFACAVAGFCELLRESGFNGGMTAEDIKLMAVNNLGDDLKGYKNDFVNLINDYIKILNKTAD